MYTMCVNRLFVISKTSGQQQAISSEDFKDQKLYVDFQLQRGSVPLILTLFKDQLYKHILESSLQRKTVVKLRFKMN